MNDNELDQRLKRGLEEIPVRNLRPDFDDFVIAASRQDLPWHVRLRQIVPPAALRVACGAIAIIIMVAVIAHLRQTATVVYRLPGSLNAPGALPGDDTPPPPPPKPGHPQPHYGGVLGAP